MSQNESPDIDVLAKAMSDATKVNEEDTNLPTLLVLYQAVFQEIGGVQAFARWFVNCVEEAKDGSQVKARLMEAMMDGVKVMTDRGLLWDGEGPESIQDDELDAEIEKLTRKMAMQVIEEKLAA